MNITDLCIIIFEQESGEQRFFFSFEEQHTVRINSLSHHLMSIC